MLAILRPHGWHKSFGIIVSVCVGVLYIANSNFEFLLCIAHFRNLIEEKHFQFDQQYYKHPEGLKMGATISAILAEVYMKYIEHTEP
jgi:hypothetical protein